MSDVLPAGRYYEDFEPGQIVTTRSVTITEAHVALFAALSGDHNPLHVDELAAAEGPFGTRVAHGQLGMAMAAGLISQTGVFTGTTVALLGYREWRFVRPIRFGDTIQVRMTIEDKRETSAPDRGIVSRRLEVLNQRGEIVQHGCSDLLVRRRPA